MTIKDYYDAWPVRTSSLADIETQACDDLWKLAGYRGFDITSNASPQILLNWGLLATAGNQLALTVAGILFLSRRPQDYLPGAYVSAIRIHGIEISIEPSDQKLIEGCLLNVLEDSKRFLDTYLLRRGLELDVHSEFPDFVLREALVNAIAHRDYTLDEPIRLIVFDDHIEVRSPGQLPDRVALKSLPMSAHVMRNPIIYTMLYRARLASDAGNGIPRIIRLTQQAVGRTPDLRLEGNEFVLSLPRRKPDSSS